MPWLRDGTGERLMYTFGACVDILMERRVQGTNAHIPTRAVGTSLREIANDRLLVPGLTEPDASLQVRTQHAFETWQLAGLPRAALGQILGYLLTLTPKVRTVATRYDPSTYPPTRVSSSWNTYPVGRNLAAEPVPSYCLAGGNGDLDWDSLSPVTGSFGSWGAWFVLYSVAPNAWVAIDGKWGSAGKWGDGFGWGVDKTTNFFRTITLFIIGTFKPANVWVRDVVVSFDAALFDPSQPAGGGVNPDGRFANWSKVVNGVRVASRFSNARYCGEVL